MIGIAIIMSNPIKAQVSVNINIGSPPMWGPVGYAEVRYYYLPDVEAYYYIQTSMFIYYGGGVWIHRTYLPSIYSNYDLYGGYKVVMVDYYGTTPYVNFKEHKVKYKKGYRGPSQKTIGVRSGNGHSPQKQQNKGNEAKQKQNSYKENSHENKGGGQGNGGGQNKGGGKGKK